VMDGLGSGMEMRVLYGCLSLNSRGNQDGRGCDLPISAVRTRKYKEYSLKLQNAACRCKPDALSASATLTESPKRKCGGGAAGCTKTSLLLFIE
jgi:hypothetical protein